MIPHDQLRTLVLTEESELLERKKSCPNGSELRQTLVAFANSVPPGQFGVLLLGVAPDGSLHSVDSPDQTQKSILRIATQECYPPIRCSLQLFRHDQRDLLAVIIPYSDQRPHFSGRSYVRIGSVSKEASDPQFEQLIASRHDKVAKISGVLGQVIDVRFRDGVLRTDSHPSAGFPSDGAYKVMSCDRWLVMLQDFMNSWIIGVPTDCVKLEWSAAKKNLRLFVDHGD
jgi:hypothetical protein